jgi:hypothetical protein
MSRANYNTYTRHLVCVFLMSQLTNNSGAYIQESSCVVSKRLHLFSTVVDRSREKRRSITESQGAEEYPT